MRTLKLKATEPQAQFHKLDCVYPLFVGGYGSGKSEAMCNQAIMDASHSSDAVIALYAPTYDLVNLILIPRLCTKLTDLGLEYVLNKVDKTIIIKEPGFGSFILRTLDNPARIVGYESYRAHIDEIDTLPTGKAEEAWNKIIARNRQRPRGIESPTNRVSAYTTPEGYRFAYKRWVDSKTASYQRVHAPSASNPFLPSNYLDLLRETYPKELAEAYIEGNFVNLTGGNVYYAYSREAHRSNERIRLGEVLYIGCDFNVMKQAATIYVKREGGKEWHIVSELTDMLDTPEMIRIIQQKWPQSKIVIYPDASGRSRKTVNASISDIALLQQAGFEVRARDANPLVKDRVAAMNLALSKGIIKINDKECPTVAKCLEQQSYDKNGEPDKKTGVDHQNDATTYLIAYEMPVRRPVAAIPISFAV